MRPTTSDIDHAIKVLNGVRTTLSEIKHNSPDERSALLEASHGLDGAIAGLKSYRYQQSAIFQELNQDG